MSVCMSASGMSRGGPEGGARNRDFLPAELRRFTDQKLISSSAIGGVGLRATAISKSTAPLFTISWLSEICVSLINVAISRLKCHTYLTTKAEFYPQFGGKYRIIIKAFSDKSDCTNIKRS